MALVVFDMGIRVETPMRPQPQRIQASTATAAARALRASDASRHRAEVQAYLEQEHPEKKPDLVAVISDILHREVQTLKPEQSLAQAWEVFERTGYHHFPVINDKKQVLAMLSDGDLLRALVKQPRQKLDTFWQQPVLYLAKHPVLCVQEQTDIRQSSNLLYEYNIGALPVLNHQLELCGIVTRSDILRLLSHYGPMELWA
ncbi:MAG: hypothetical protein RL217_896 [Pseudomonadota bacterium]|jgi:CBS domain-containing protein